MKKIFLAALLAALLLTACAPAATEPAPTTQPQTTAPAQTTLPAETTAAPTTEPAITAPEELCALLAESGSSLQHLAQLGCTQLMTVVSNGSSAQLELYIMENYRWQQQKALSCPGFVGKNGTNPQKQEGDKCSPRGLFPILEAFYIDAAPETGLSAFQITNGTYWVDDPNSAYYNQRVIGTENKDWRSAERMWKSPDVYEYGFVIGYNTEAVPHAGSAIFFHVSDHYTAGCVATDRAHLLQYLAALNAHSNPYILIY